MAKRYDTDYEDYDEDESPTHASASPKSKPSDAPPAPEPVIYEDLIEQFHSEYSPASFEEDADEQMDISNLRDYFGAWPPYGYPDAIPVYLDHLRRLGFRLKTNFEHQPVLFLKRNEIEIAEEIEF